MGEGKGGGRERKGKKRKIDCLIKKFQNIKDTKKMSLTIKNNRYLC